MHTMTINQFQGELDSYMENVLSNHVPIKVTCHPGKAFVVVSADDWEREQETLYVLQNQSLTAQIAASVATHTKRLSCPDCALNKKAAP